MKEKIKMRKSDFFLRERDKEKEYERCGRGTDED